jgi:hypothetical protein
MGDGRRCVTLGLGLMSLNCAFRDGENNRFYVYFTTIWKESKLQPFLELLSQALVGWAPVQNWFLINTSIISDTYFPFLYQTFCDLT